MPFDPDNHIVTHACGHWVIKKLLTCEQKKEEGEKEEEGEKKEEGEEEGEEKEEGEEEGEEKEEGEEEGEEEEEEEGEEEGEEGEEEEEGEAEEEEGEEEEEVKEEKGEGNEEEKGEEEGEMGEETRAEEETEKRAGKDKENRRGPSLAEMILDRIGAGDIQTWTTTNRGSFVVCRYAAAHHTVCVFSCLAPHHSFSCSLPPPLSLSSLLKSMVRGVREKVQTILQPVSSSLRAGFLQGQLVLWKELNEDN